MGNCLINRKKRHNNLRYREKVCMCHKNEGSNIMTYNIHTEKNNFLWYDETERNTICIGDILDRLTLNDNVFFRYTIERNMAHDAGVNNNTTIQDYIDRIIKTRGYQCFYNGFLYIPFQ